MALVAYDNSDSSDFEDEANDTGVNDRVEETQPAIPEVSKKIDHINGECPSLFNLLPQPTSQKLVVTEEDDEFLHKKEKAANVKPKAKITVPSLSDFKDVESSIPSTKPRTTNEKKSGLLSMLPQPRNAVTSTIKSFTPHVLTKKPQNSTVKKKDPLPSTAKKVKVDSKPIINDCSDDSEDEVQNDFFSINKPVEIPVADMPLDIEEQTKSEDRRNVAHSAKMPRSIESYFKQNVEQTHVELNADTTSYNEAEFVSTSNDYNTPANQNSNELVLDDEAIMKLCGSRAKRKQEEIKIVDFNQQEVLDDARQMLLKGLMDDTSQRMSSSKKRGNEPTSQQRRKHQITYLAHQAKAKEAELQNQWANNRMTKRKTQSKYGF